MASKKKRHNNVFCHPDIINPINTLLANIRFASVDKQMKSFLVTSVSQDEGKTTISTNLAAAIAKSGKKCIIVDADFRKNSIRKIFDFKPRFGLYSLLGGRCKVNEAVYKTPINNLFFLDCEDNIPNPADIFASSRFKMLVRYLEQKFDYVIFDTPPLISFIDAAVLGSVVNATLLIVREGKTKKALLPKAVEQLKHAKANILGVVYTFSSDTKANQYYYAYYNKSGKRVAKRMSGEEPITSKSNYANINENLSSWLKPDQITYESPQNIPRNCNQNIPNEDQSNNIPQDYNDSNTNSPSSFDDRLRAMHDYSGNANNSAANQSITDVFKSSQNIDLDTDSSNNNSQNPFL